MWSLKQMSKQKEDLIDLETRWVGTRGEEERCWWVSKMGEGSQLDGGGEQLDLWRQSHCCVYGCWTFNAVFSSVAQSLRTLSDPMDCSMPGFVVHHQLLEFAQTHVHWVSDAIQPSHPPLSPSPPSFNLPSIRVFSNESDFLIRWPKYWSFNFSINPSNEYSGLIFFKIDWFDLLTVQETLKSLLQVQKYWFFSTQPSLGSNSHPYVTTEKT